MAVCRLKRWWVVYRVSRTRGAVREYLQGHIYGDRRWPDGTLITTSAVVWRDDREVMTASGHRYALEEPGEDTASALGP